MCQHCSTKGGPGSGNFNHEGRLGQVGGSAPADSSSAGSSPGDKPASASSTAGTKDAYKRQDPTGGVSPVSGKSYEDLDKWDRKAVIESINQGKIPPPEVLWEHYDIAVRRDLRDEANKAPFAYEKINPTVQDAWDHFVGLVGKLGLEHAGDTYQSRGGSRYLSVGKKDADGFWEAELTIRIASHGGDRKDVNLTTQLRPDKYAAAWNDAVDRLYALADKKTGKSFNAKPYQNLDHSSLPFPSLRRKSWLRQAAIDLWTKAEKHAQAEIEDAALEFLKAQRKEIVKQLRTLDNDKPGIVADGEPEHAAEKIISKAFEPTDWDEALREAIGPAIAKTIVRGYLSSKALQAGRRRRFPPVWRKAEAEQLNKAKPPKNPSSDKPNRPSRPATPADAQATDWSDQPLTDEEVRQVLSFELPANVTRSVFAHTREIMEKPYWKDINATERQRMQWSIQQGIEEGKTLRDIAKDIQADIGSDETRAKRIAVTETTGAYSAGAVSEMEEAEAAGVKIAKVWVDIGDDKVRPTHEDANGQVVEGSDGKFIVGGYECVRPGDPDLPAEERCGCRCGMYGEPIIEAEKSRWIQRGKMWIDPDWQKLMRLEAEALLSGDTKRWNPDRPPDDTAAPEPLQSGDE